MISLAHLMTSLRIVLIPFFPILYLYGMSFGIPLEVTPFILLFLFVICQISDVLDGLFARRRNEVTDLGKILDPMADSMLSLSILFTFTKPPVSIPLLLVLVFLYREFAISSLRILCALKGHALAARSSGKIKTGLQSVVFFMVMILIALNTFEMVSKETLQVISLYSVAIAAVYTTISACEYFYANRKFLIRSLASKGK